MMRFVVHIENKPRSGILALVCQDLVLCTVLCDYRLVELIFSGSLSRFV